MTIHRGRGLYVHLVGGANLERHQPGHHQLLREPEIGVCILLLYS